MVSCFKLRQIAKQLHHGAVIAYPTEAVYGLGCDPLDEEAVYRLLALKSRSVKKGLILIAANFEQLAPFIKPLSVENREKLNQQWPGPATWLLPTRETVPNWLRGEFDSIAVRVTDHPVVQELCLAFGGAIVSTSANPSGKAPAKSASRVRGYFGNRLPVLHGALGSRQTTTPITDLLTGKVLRG